MSLSLCDPPGCAKIVVCTSNGTIPAPSITIQLTLVRFRFQIQHEIPFYFICHCLIGLESFDSDSNSRQGRFRFHQALKGVDPDSSSDSGIRIVPSVVCIVHEQGRGLSQLLIVILARFFYVY